MWFQVSSNIFIISFLPQIANESDIYIEKLLFWKSVSLQLQISLYNLWYKDYVS